MKDYRYFLLVLVLFGIGCSENVVEPKIIDLSSYKNKNEISHGELQFELLEMHLGQIKSGNPAIATFNFINGGVEACEIEYVNPDCTCTSAIFNDGPLSPGEHGNVTLTFDTENKKGKEELFTTVKTNTKTQFYKLKIIVEVID